MNDNEKPFGTVDIVILMLLSIISDITDLVTLLLFLVPVIGQVIFGINSLVVSPVLWAVIQTYFIMKTGMSKASLLAVVGGLGNIANIPGSESITTALGIAMANSPKAAEAAAIAGKKKVKGGVGAEKAAAGAAEKGPEETGRPSEVSAEAGGGAAKKEKSAPTATGEAPVSFEEIAGGNVFEDAGKNEVDLRNEGYAGYKLPDWMRDKSVDEAMKLRDERMEVAKRMGMSSEEAAALAIRQEEKDAARRRKAILGR